MSLCMECVCIHDVHNTCMTIMHLHVVYGISVCVCTMWSQELCLLHANQTVNTKVHISKVCPSVCQG